MLSWAWTESWRAPRRQVTWNAAEEWSRSFRAVVKAAGRRLDTCLGQWDVALDDIGGDPSREDWKAFRPLRLSREEDWSDWLFHLLTSSESGRCAARLLGRDVRQAEESVVSSAYREFRASDYRADLVVHFPGGEWVHIEVKIGDLDLAKTPDTTEALRNVVVGQFTGDYLLVPAADLRYWDDERKRLNGRADTITTLTWLDVAKALRASVLERTAESLRWRVWALTFLGAVEQQLLGFPCVGTDDIKLDRYRPRGVDVERVRLLEELLPVKEES
jgi:hypothetical protein